MIYTKKLILWIFFLHIPTALIQGGMGTRFLSKMHSLPRSKKINLALYSSYAAFLAFDLKNSRANPFLRNYYIDQLENLDCSNLIKKLKKLNLTYNQTGEDFYANEFWNVYAKKYYSRYASDGKELFKLVRKILDRDLGYSNFRIKVGNARDNSWASCFYFNTNVIQIPSDDFYSIITNGRLTSEQKAIFGHELTHIFLRNGDLPIFSKFPSIIFDRFFAMLSKEVNHSEEYACDRGGSDLDPNGLIKFFKKGSYSPQESFTHPAHIDRINRLLILKRKKEHPKWDHYDHFSFCRNVAIKDRIETIVSFLKKLFAQFS